MNNKATYSPAAWIGLLFVAVVVVVFGLILTGSPPEVASQIGSGSIGEALWGARSMDLLGQAAIIFAGVLGVAVLFRKGDLRK